MDLIAHRGFADEYPENTLLAVREAATIADGIEVDARRCGSGELVAIHDGTVDRVTATSGGVGEFSAADLASLSVQGSNEGVPTLREVFEACPPDVTLHVECKETGLAGDLLALVREFDQDVVVSSFQEGALRECREAGEVPLAYLHADPGGVPRAIELGASFVHPHHDLVDADYVSRANEAGLGANAWTVTGEREAKRLDGLGVDGVIADGPDVLPSTSGRRRDRRRSR